MRKVIPCKTNVGFIKSCIKTICTIRGQELSDSELSVLLSLIKYNNNNSLTLDVHLSRQIREELGIGQSLFGTSVSRLESKKCIRKEGKVIMLDPAFNRISEWKELVIRDSSAEKI